MYLHRLQLRRVSTSTWLRKIGGYAMYLLHYTNSQVLNIQVSRVAITENVPIRMRVNYSGQRIEFTMPYRIDAAKWDATNEE